MAHLTRARKTVSKDTAPFSFLFSHFGGSAGGRIKSFVCSVGVFLSGTSEGLCFRSQRLRNARTLTPDFPLFTTSYSSLPFSWKCTTNKSRRKGCNSFSRVLIVIFGLFRTVLGQILNWSSVELELKHLMHPQKLLRYALAAPPRWRCTVAPVCLYFVIYTFTFRIRLIYEHSTSRVRSKADLKILGRLLTWKQLDVRYSLNGWMGLTL